MTRPTINRPPVNLRQFDLTLEDTELRLSDGRTVNCDVEFRVMAEFEKGEKRTWDYPGTPDAFAAHDITPTKITAYDDEGNGTDIPLDKATGFEDHIHAALPTLETRLAEIARDEDERY